jgi:ketosteroid isomerase-like protein
MIKLFPPALLLLLFTAHGGAALAQPPRTASANSASQQMAGADSPKASNLAEVRAIVNRQAQAWEKNNFAIAAVDWLPTGELISPGGHFAAKELEAVMTDYFKHFGDVRVTVKNIFLSPDGNKAAIEWDWEVTRLRDKARAVTHDAIIVDLKGGKISSWREYFDLGDSLDAKP